MADVTLSIPDDLMADLTAEASARELPQAEVICQRLAGQSWADDSWRSALRGEVVEVLTPDAVFEPAPDAGEPVTPEAEYRVPPPEPLPTHEDTIRLLHQQAQYGSATAAVALEKAIRAMPAIELPEADPFAAADELARRRSA